MALLRDEFQCIECKYVSELIVIELIQVRLGPVLVLELVRQKSCIRG